MRWSTCTSSFQFLSGLFDSVLRLIIQKSRYYCHDLASGEHFDLYYICALMAVLTRFLVQNCQDKFSEVASSPNFTFIGNIDIGKDLALTSLPNHYDAVVFAYGASKDRKLGIHGEGSLKGIYSARAFVGWYNGLPEYADLAPDLEAGEEAIVVGQGNVALDIARTLLSDIDRLKTTDMTEQAIATFAKSRVKRVRVVGRRGPMQVSPRVRSIRHGTKAENLAGIIHDQRSPRTHEASGRQLRADRSRIAPSQPQGIAENSQAPYRASTERIHYS